MLDPSIRRSRHLVSYWDEDSRLQTTNYATGSTLDGGPLAMEVLDCLDDWTPVEKLVEILGPDRETEVRDAVRILLDRGLVESMAETPDPRERAMGRWRGWNPAAGFFHQVTRDLSYAPGSRHLPVLITHNSPTALKEYPEAQAIELPASETSSALPRVLLERRSWRRFGPGKVALQDLATLLGLTWGVQGWVHLRGTKPVALKTSPSGGARHSLEVYVLAFDVEGLAAGTYHYQPDTHQLADLNVPVSRSCLATQLPSQPWFHRAAAFFFMTSVLARVQWKYEYARAYRTVLIEAGHFSQSFLLTATALGLAPFCTAALGDSSIERHLGIDGIDESVIFANGVGTRPPGVDWAPKPEGEDPLHVTAPSHGETTIGQKQD